MKFEDPKVRGLRAGRERKLAILVLTTYSNNFSFKCSFDSFSVLKLMLNTVAAR